MNSGSPDGIVLHFLLYFPDHKHPFNCSDTALRVPEVMIGVKFKIFVCHCVCFVSQQIWCQNSYPGSLALSRLRKPG